MFRRLAAVLGYEPRRRREPESVGHLKRLAEQLNEKATRFREVAGRAALLEQRIEFLETDSVTWERRAARVRGSELAGDAERICGRLEGQMQEATADLAQLRSEEAFLRNLLTSERRGFAAMVEQARRLGHDVSGCLLFVDLTRPECPADDALIDDADADFIGRVIDAHGVH